MIKNVEDGYYDECGVIECGKLIEVFSQMRHVMDAEVDFDARLAHRVT